MEITKIYEALETQENGADLVAGLKLHNKKLNDENASYRLKVKDLDTVTDKLSALSEVDSILKTTGLNADGITKLIQDSTNSTDKSTELERKLNMVVEKLELSEKKAIDAENARLQAIKEKDKSALKSSFEGELTKHFGSFKARLMTKDFIDNDNIVLDEDNKPTYKDADGIYGLEEGIERIKGTFADELVSQNNGANSSQNRVDSTQPKEYLMKSEEDIMKHYVRDIPLKRPNDPMDIAAMVVFLSSEGARNISGQSYNVDGGLIPS